MNTSHLFDDLAVFFKEKSRDRHNTELTSCVWIFIDIQLTDLQIIFMDFSNSGMLCRQGPHQVAQKSIKTSPWLVSCSKVASVITCAIFPPFSVMTTDSAFLLIFYTKRGLFRNICYELQVKKHRKCLRCFPSS